MENTVNRLTGVNVICEMSKKRSPIITMFYYNEDDPFLVNYVEYRRASGIITYEAMITFPELDERLEKMSKKGYFMLDRHKVLTDLKAL
jgi:hypothetical protein